VPTSWKSNAKGPDNDPYYGFKSICKMLERLASDSKKSSQKKSSDSSSTSKSSKSAKKSDNYERKSQDEDSYASAAAHAPSSDSSIVVNEGEGDVNHLTKSMGESGVLVEKEH